MSLTNQLSLFLDVVQQGSFSKAAALHDMDNSSLSKQIKKLEAHLGVQLLNRSTRSISLTPAGEEIVPQVQQLQSTLTQIHNIADSYHSEPKGHLRITSATLFGQQYVQPVIAKFMQRYPEVKISLSLDDRRSDLISDHFDLAFRIGKLRDSNLVAKKLANTNFALVASKDFIAKHGEPQTPEALIKLPAVVYFNGDTTLDQMKIGLTPESDTLTTLKMRGNYKVSDVRSMINAVCSGLGYCQLDLFNLDQSIEKLGLEPLLTDYHLSTLDTGIYAIYPHRKPTLLVREFIQTFQDHIGSPPYWESHIPNYHTMYLSRKS
ncbi:LysR family transcriptional regulator [Vibrio sp. SCSIO 43136]|uniref:LysR family transcriptional regulator n=1 Tax=Vibrio sp. SCSIO 43136 TaxID=2819101 RepID=UPI002074ADC1|nr:LysR family transcriptional regulator [Vibrio sp. SCSIO 43136]USD66164.1 LysR family transcriptional regulator [Vibrio sp. SCSIO 43136]